jgi:hypothetical protein
MRTRSARDLPARLKGLQRRLEHWRRTREGHSRIPETLWASAVKAAGRYGLNPTAQALRLDYYSLKKRVEAAACRRASDREGATAFVELAPAPPTGSSECMLELEDPGGAKMRVHLKGVEAPDLAALSRSFWSTTT